MRWTRMTSGSAPWRTGLVALGVGVGVCLLWSSVPPIPRAPRYVGHGHEQPVRGGTFTFYQTSNVRTLDPHVAYDAISAAGVRLLFDGLLDYDSDANLVPNLAKALPTQSPDGRYFEFELRRGVRFHHGRELTADDVSWSIHRMLDPKTGSPGPTFFQKLVGFDAFRNGKHDTVGGVEVLGRYRIGFRLSEADQTFLNAMAMNFAYPIPREHYERVGADAGTQPVGTGPFTLRPSDWERGVRVVFHRFRRYWRTDKPHVDRVVMLENVPRQAAMMRFQNGEVDMAHAFSPPDYLRFKASPRWEPYTEERPQAVLWGIAMNTQMPPFDNVHLRRAVAFAIDRAGWSRARAGRLKVTGQPLPPNIGGHDPRLPERQRFDLDRAKREMRLAGYANGYPKEITYWVGESETSRFFGELAQADLKRIGIRIRLKPVSFALYLEETGKPGRAQMFLSGWAQDFPDASNFIDVLFHSRNIHPVNSNNRSFYENPELDALLDRARVEQNRDKRIELYQRASSILCHDAPWAFLWNDMTYEAWQPYVHGYVIHPVHHNDIRFVWLDLPRKPFDMAREMRSGS